MADSQAQPNDEVVHEFRFTAEDFDKIRRLAKEHTGISLSDAKRNMVYSRLSRRLRQLGLTGFDSYCKLIEQGHEQELDQFTNAITTNLTAFFREPHHFDYLANTLLPRLVAANAGSRRIRIWSAGCSTGEEPYSIAMVLRENFATINQWDVKILATDLDSNVLAHAERGVYEMDRVQGVSEIRLRKWFRNGRGENAGLVRVAAPIKELVTFRRLNLMHQWPMKGPFDVVFCRNVVIYFDKVTQKVLFDRFANYLAKDGHLFIGHSETLYNVTTRFALIGHNTYQRQA